MNAAPQQQNIVNICGRTAEVQTAILVGVSGATCSTITSAQLASIDGLLFVKNYSSTSVEPSEFAGLTGVENLLFQGSAIETLLPGAFQDLTSLEKLSLDQNRIKNLETGVFRGLTSLTELRMSRNRITEINPDVFNDLAALETLSIYHNNITTLDANTFGGLTSLTSLDISDNPITSLHVDTFDPLTSLESLTFDDLSLTNSAWDEDLFASLTNLTYLRFVRNGITTLDVDIFDDLTNLETLDIRENAITALPDGIFDGLTSLETLYLNNALTTLPANVFDELTALRLLYLNNNSLSSLPTAAFAGLTSSLKLLLLHRNSLPSLHVDVFDGLTGLTQLTLSYNELTTVPEGLFEETTALQYLFLNNNMISSVPENTFDGLTSLLRLSLSNNNLASLNVNLFDETAALAVLYLNNNTLAALDATIFDSLTALRALFLHGNSLTTLDADLFDGLGALNTLYLNDNGLTALPTALFEDLDDTLQHLVLTDNSIAALPAMVFAGLTGLKGLDLSCNGLTALDLGRFDPFASSLTYLDITGNSFTTAPTDSAVRAKLTSVANLYISEANTECLLPNNVDLSGLTVSAGMLEPAFEAPGFTGGYGVYVAYDVSSIVINPTTTDPHAAITSTPADIDLNTPGIQVNLPTDRTYVSFKVTAENGVSTRAYVIEVFRDHPPATNARLSGLTLSGVTVTEDFGSRTYAYTATTSLATTTVTPELSDPDATAVIKLGGMTDADGTVNLATGNNVITVEVTAEDGTTMLTYTVTITRMVANFDPANQAPTVSATAKPSTVYGGGTVTLDGTASAPDGDALAIAWTSGGGGTFAPDAFSLNATWIATATETAHTVKLTVTATDTGGLSASVTVSVLVEPFPQPNAATGLQGTVGDDNSVSLTWTIPSQPQGVTIANVQVQQRMSGGAFDPPSWDTVVTLPGHATFTGVPELAADTEYFFRIRLTTTHGLNADSPPLNVRTLTGAPAPRHFATVWPTQTSITLTWFTVETAAEYKLEYRKHGESEWTRISGDFDHLPSTSDHRDAFGVAAGLECETRYDFRVSARGSGETRNDGSRYPPTLFGSYATISAQTGECAQEGRVTNLLVSVEPGCATLTWTPPLGDRDTGYRVERYTYTNNRSHRSEPETLVEEPNRVATRYEDCSAAYRTDGAEHVYSVTALDSNPEPDEEGAFGTAYTSLLVFGPSREPEGPRNVRLTHDRQSSRGLAWDAPRDPWLTTVKTARAGSGPQQVVTDPWTTGYRVERREYRRLEDGGWALPEFDADEPIWNATMTVGASTTGTPAIGYFGLGSDAFGAMTQTTFTHPAAGSWEVFSLTIRTGDRLSLTIYEIPPPHENVPTSLFEHWVLVLDGRSFPFEVDDGVVGANLPVNWPNPGLSWTDGQEVSVQLVERERFEWDAVRDETDGDTGTSFTDSTDKGDRQYVYRVWAYNDRGLTHYSWRGDWAFNGGDPGGDPEPAVYIPPPPAQQQGGETPSFTPATGAPAISGTPWVGEALTANTSGIEDEDGLDDVTYSYQWIADGSDIAGATGFTYTLTSSEQGQTIQVRVTFAPDAFSLNATWIATATETAHTVKLTVTATDTGGLSASVTVSVLVEPFPQPNAATGLQGTVGDDNSVSLTWTIPSQPQGVTIANVQVQQRMSGGAFDPPSWDTVVTLPGHATFTGVPELAADTEYFFRIRLTTTHGLNADSPPLNVRTLTGAPAPRHFATVWPTQTSITLTWFTVETAAEYKLEYRKHGESEWTRISGDFDHLPSTSDHRDAFGVAAGLECETRYDFRVSARGSGETRNDGSRYPPTLFGSYATISAQTGECAQEGRVTNLLVSVEPGCATLTWTPPLGDRDTGYRVERYTYTNNRSHRSEPETLVEEPNRVATRYEDCSAAYRTDGAEHVYSVTALDSNPEPDEEGAFGTAYTSLLVFGPSREPEGPRNVRLTHDRQSSRGLAWDAPRDPWLTTVKTARAGSGPQQVVTDPWTTGYRVERREYRRLEDGGWALPEFDADEPIWNATMTVGASTTGTPAIGYFGLGSDAFGAMTQTTFTHPAAGSWEVFSLTIRTGDRLSLTIYEIPPPHENVPTSLFEHWVLVLDGRSFPFEVDDGVVGANLPVNWPNPGLSWTDGQEVSVQLVERERFEWDAVRDETDGDTGTSFTDSTDKGDRQYVYRVWAYNDRGLTHYSWRGDWAFNGGDPGGDPEPAVYIPPPPAQQQGGETPSFTPATGAPAISGTPWVGEALTANTSGIEDEDGLDDVTYSYQWIADGSDIAGATGFTYTLTSSEQGQTIQVRVTFADDADNAETLTSAATETETVTAKANTAPTGLPTISGTTQVGETLTADTSGIADADGLTNVSYSYQWMARGSDIDGATGSSYELTGSEQGQTITVRVTFTDDADNTESLTSVATETVAQAPSPLTVSLENAATSHNGTDVFTFEIRFSEQFGLSYRTLRDHAFTVVGGEVKKTQRMDRDSDTPNTWWLITVEPDGNGDVTITLPATTDCTDDGAICTEDKRKLSNSLSVTVTGPGG